MLGPRCARRYTKAGKKPRKDYIDSGKLVVRSFTITSPDATATADSGGTECANPFAAAALVADKDCDGTLSDAELDRLAKSEREGAPVVTLRAGVPQAAHDAVGNAS